MRRFRLFLSDVWSLAAPYWKSEERWRARLLLSVVIILNLALVGVTVLLTFWQRAFYDALQAKDWDSFIALLLWWRITPADGFVPSFTLISAAFVPLTVYALYLRQALQIRWRRWTTERYLKSWLDDRAYYRVALLDPATDNPDQRIAEDIRLFVDNALILGIGVLRAAAALFSFVFLLWSLSSPITILGVTIHGYLVWVALIYAGIGTGITHWLGRRLITLNYIEQKVEADLRFGLVRIRENAEGIAFYGGEANESRELSRRFGGIADNWRAIMTVTKHLTFFTTGFGQVALVFPFAVVAPAYFFGRMGLGGIFQISNAFVQVQGATSWIVDNYATLTSWCATVNRLRQFTRSINAAHNTGEGPVIETGEANEFSLEAFNLDLPTGQRLLTNTAARVEHGERVLLVGYSGSGKSTLLRAMAGIWPFGSGTIRRAPGRVLFVPQRSYIPLGTLKRAVCYPMQDGDFSDAQVGAALREVGLPQLVSRLTDSDAWERCLSGGEQQRLALARALLVCPDWLFLDEATSSLDPEAASQLYKILREKLPGTTLVSVAHEGTVVEFHDRILRVHDRFLKSEPVGIEASTLT